MPVIEGQELRVDEHWLRSPEGEIVSVTSVRPFATEHNLDPSAVLGLLRGSRRSHRGWTVLNDTPQQPRHSLVSADGEYTEFCNVTEWAEQRGLPRKPIYDILKGHRASYKGWRLPEPAPLRFAHTDGRQIQGWSLSALARAHQLSVSGLSRLHRGLQRSYKQWKKL